MITSKGFTARGSVNMKGGGSLQQEDPIEGGSSRLSAICFHLYRVYMQKVVKSLALRFFLL